jgi:hypothetical protein
VHGFRKEEALNMVLESKVLYESVLKLTA